MVSAVVVVGLVVALSLQIAIHMHLARMGSLVRDLKQYHDQIADEHRTQLAAAEQRAKQAEAQLAEAPAVVAQLRDIAAEQREIAGNLNALLATWTELACSMATQAAEVIKADVPAAAPGASSPEPLRVPERRPPPVPRGVMPPPPPPEDERASIHPPAADRGEER